MEHRSTTTKLKDISLFQALGVGCVQVLAMIPGVSRSGATIVGGLLTGMDRSLATTFSFYLAMPTLGAATLYSLLKSFSDLSSDMITSLLIGMVVAFVVSLIVMRWLLRFVASNSFRSFAVYRIIAALKIALE